MEAADVAVPDFVAAAAVADVSAPITASFPSAVIAVRQRRQRRPHRDKRNRRDRRGAQG
jgi:hypothetical protein